MANTSLGFRHYTSTQDMEAEKALFNVGDFILNAEEQCLYVVSNKVGNVPTLELYSPRVELIDLTE